jgi:hypothetical protein
MLKRNTASILILFTSLTAAIGGFSAAPAWASSESWSSLEAASIEADEASKNIDELYKQSDCNGLKASGEGFLKLAAKGSVTSKQKKPASVTGKVAELRMHLANLGVIATMAAMQQIRNGARDGFHGAEFENIVSRRAEVLARLQNTIFAVCGNGVERDISR